MLSIGSGVLKMPERNDHAVRHHISDDRPACAARATRKLIEIIQEITEGKFAQTQEDDRIIVWPERAKVRKLVLFRPAPLDVRDHVDIPLIELASFATPLLAGGHSPEAAAIIMG
jgi:hypothetical protein